MRIDDEQLETAIEIATEDHAGDRWRNAVLRGAELLRGNRCLPISPTILLVFSDSGGYYVTDGKECRGTEALCPAFAHERPCKHRASHRLLQLLKIAAASGGKMAA